MYAEKKLRKEMLHIMDKQSNNEPRSDNPRRKKRTKGQTFRQVYLPFLLIAVLIIAVVAVIVVLSNRGDPDNDATVSSTMSASKLEKRAKALLEDAEEKATLYDYEGALAILQDASDELRERDDIQNAIQAYTNVQNSLVSWTADKVPNLSFHVLIADMEAALADKTYGTKGNGRYNKNFVTVGEFSAILQQLYDNGYVLVDLDDLFEYDEETQSYKEKALLLPPNKKPVMLTETHCNYYNYMSSSHAFATKLCYGKDGFYNEMTTASGETVTGAFDVVPLLEGFIAANPTFSYRGARAILAFTGYDGIFGYRINSADENKARAKEPSDSTANATDPSETQTLTQEQSDAAALVKALREAGYTIACNTYRNIDYGNLVASDIRSDISKWTKEITPILGRTDILVFAQEGGIGSDYPNNDKFKVLCENGFRFFLSNSSTLFREVGSNYVRYNRLMVTGSNLAHHSEWFKGILDATDLLDDIRGNIPK